MTPNPKTETKPRIKPSEPPVRVMSVTSGKGGVGKTNVVVNLALSLARSGHSVLIWDADLGLANIDVLLGLRPEYNIQHLLNGEKSLKEILISGPSGIRIMPASSGIMELSQLGEGQKVRLLTELDEFDEHLDYLLIDTGAGISANVMYFNLAAQERILVVTPEPTSITDAYALIKVMTTKYNQKRFLILPNQVSGPKEAKGVYSLLVSVADKHLPSVSLDYLGYIPRDEYILKSVRMQKAVVDAFPSAESSVKFMELAQTIIRSSQPSQADGNIRFFWKRLLKL
ncbi:MAG: MinD/ParA family protein [Deltaproteobacteria bacterium]|nr:MinD/ParA family protein [Deltaproteobacteria bacterium]